MAGSGKKSLTPFYVFFGIIALAGVVLIARGAMNSGPPLTMQTLAPVATGPRGVTLGPDSAPVEIIEFSDFQCPWCGQFANLQMPDIKQRLLSTGRVRWRFVHFPLADLHRNAPVAHLAAACANEQGRFWEMHDIIYQYQNEWSESRNPQSRFEGYARRIGMDLERYRSCVRERRTWGQVLADKALGDSLRLGGTPTFFVNGRQLPGTPSVDQLIAMADSITAAAGAGRRGAIN